MSGDPFIYCRGEFVRQSQAVIPAADHGYLFGMGLFETFRTHNGIPFLPDRHLERLRRGMAAFRIDAQRGRFTHPERGVRALREVAGELLKLNEMEEAVLRLTVSAGEAGAGLPPGLAYERPNELVFIRPVPPPPPPEGVAVRLLETPRLPGEFFPRGKTAGYANSLRAWFELREEGGAEGEGILLTAEGRVSEGVFSNIFWVIGGRLFTPGLETHALPGVTRGLVLELAREAAIPVEEGSYSVEDLRRAEAVFLTNAARGIVAVSRLNCGRGELLSEFDTGSSRIFNLLETEYRARVRRESSGGGDKRPS